MTKQTYYRKGNFHKVVSYAKRRNDILYDSRTLASARMKQGLEDTVTNRGFWVSECTAHFPNEGLVLLVSPQANVLLPNSKEATKSHCELYGKNISSDEKLYSFPLDHNRNLPRKLAKYGARWDEVYMALAEESRKVSPEEADILTIQEKDMKVLPYKRGIGINIPIWHFGKDPITRFLFRQDAEKYAEWLKSTTGASKVSLRMERAKNYGITEPFACGLWCDGIYLPTTGFLGEGHVGFGDFDDTDQELSCDYHGGIVASTSKALPSEKKKKIPMGETLGKYIKLQMKRGTNVSHWNGRTVFVANIDPNLGSVRVSDSHCRKGLFETLPLPMSYIKKYEIIKEE